MSPDYDGDDDGPPEPVPYADLSDPQSLNLYGYVENNPLSSFDSDGHDCIYADGNGGGYVQRGDCTNAGGVDDNGVYVNGTIDVNSFQYNASNNSSTFTYTPDDAPAGTIGVGTLQGPDLNGGFDPGSLAAGVFGAGSASTWNNSYGAVNAAGKAEFNLFGFVFPFETLAADLLSGGGPSGTQAAGISKKPGTLGMGKGTDALRRENKVASDIAKKLGADKNAVHELLQEGSQMEGRALTYREGLEYVAKALGKVL